jgi:hypothetical protein
MISMTLSNMNINLEFTKMKKKQLIAEMLMDNKTYTEIQEKLGVSPATISEVKKFLSSDIPNEPISSVDISEESIEDSKPDIEIAVIDYMIEKLAPQIAEKYWFKRFKSYYVPALKYFALVNELSQYPRCVTQEDLEEVYIELLDAHGNGRDDATDRKKIWSELFCWSYTNLTLPIKEPVCISE